MSDEAERIRRQMQSVRRDLRDDVQEVVEGAKQLSDWRYYVRQHPWLSVGSAVALGFLATPARRKALGGDAKKILEQLQASGLATAATRAAPLGGLTGGGIAGRIIALAAPIVARHVAAAVAQHFSGARKSQPEEAAPPGVVAP